MRAPSSEADVAPTLGYVLSTAGLHRMPAAIFDGRSGQIVVIPPASGRRNVSTVHHLANPTEVYPWEFVSELQNPPDFDHGDRNSSFRRPLRGHDVSGFAVTGDGIYLSAGPLMTVNPATWKGRNRRRRKIVEVGFIVGNDIFPVRPPDLAAPGRQHAELAQRFTTAHPEAPMTPSQARSLLTARSRVAEMDFHRMDLGQLSRTFLGDGDLSTARPRKLPSPDIAVALARAIRLPPAPGQPHGVEVPEQRSAAPAGAHGDTWRRRGLPQVPDGLARGAMHPKAGAWRSASRLRLRKPPAQT